MVPRRQFPRYVADLTAKLTHPSGATHQKVKVMKLGIAGCGIEGSTGLKLHEECEVTIEWEGREFHTQATVAWINKQAEVGLKFRPLDPPGKELLRKICSNLRLSPPNFPAA